MADQNPPLVPSLQMLVNQANQDAGPPGQYILANQDTPPPAPPANPLSKTPAVKPQGLNDYLPKPNANDEEMAGYKRQANEALAAQGGGLDSLQKYIQQMQDKPQGINWTPLAAYIDSQNPKSKMLEAAKAMAPMSPEERDKQLFDLQVKLQGGRAAMSADQLKALAEQIKMRHDNDRDAWTRQYQDRMATAAETRADNAGGLTNVRAANLTAQAVDKVVNDKVLAQHSQRINGADRILAQLDDVANGKLVDTEQLYGDVNKEYVNLLAGSNNVALGNLERTEYTTGKGHMKGIMQKISAHPESVNTPEILQQLRTGVEGMKGSYNKAYDARAESLRRNYVNFPDATKQMSDKIAEMKGQYGIQPAAASAASSNGPAVGPHGATIKQKDHTFTWNPKTQAYE